ncbi:MAG: hypothetical protein KF778_21435 [Rhodocyclaceae bacterium]|nr:hypothetical protein [Rhodocyclaceae bacterium]
MSSTSELNWVVADRTSISAISAPTAIMFVDCRQPRDATAQCLATANTPGSVTLRSTPPLPAATAIQHMVCVGIQEILEKSGHPPPVPICRPVRRPCHHALVAVGMRKGDRILQVGHRS